MPRKQYRVRVTGDQRKDIDPHQIANILLDLMELEAAAAQRDADLQEQQSSLEECGSEDAPFATRGGRPCATSPGRTR